MSESYGNRLLDALPTGERTALKPKLQLVCLEDKQLLHEQGESIQFVYFPVSAVISLLATTGHGPSVESATVGNEGVVGLPIFLGQDTAIAMAVTQYPGRALRMDADDFRIFSARLPFTVLLHRYIHALFGQTTQSVACHRFHSVEQRLARWLLVHQHRTGADEFPFTHDFLADMLGAQRSTISEATGKFQKAGLIDNERGKVRIRTREGLESVTCECYRIVRRNFEALLV